MAELKIKKWPVVGVLVPEVMKKDLSEKIKKNRDQLPLEDDRCSLSGYVRLLIRRDLYGSDEPTPDEKEYHKLREQGVLITEVLGGQEHDEATIRYAQRMRDWKSKVDQNAEAIKERLRQRAYTALELANEFSFTRQYILQIMKRMKPKPQQIQMGHTIYYTLGPPPIGFDKVPRENASPSDDKVPLEDLE